MWLAMASPRMPAAADLAPSVKPWAPGEVVERGADVAQARVRQTRRRGKRMEAGETSTDRPAKARSFAVSCRVEAGRSFPEPAAAARSAVPRTARTGTGTCLLYTS